MKVQVRFNQDELTAAIKRHLEAEGYTVKAVRFSYDTYHHQLDPGDGVSCEADVEIRSGRSGLTFPHSHIPGARAFTAETGDPE